MASDNFLPAIVPEDSSVSSRTRVSDAAAICEDRNRFHGSIATCLSYSLLQFPLGQVALHLRRGYSLQSLIYHLS